jgi:oligopeptide/dipeptide ABC transporter ATP-binding protein
MSSLGSVKEDLVRSDARPLLELHNVGISFSGKTSGSDESRKRLEISEDVSFQIYPGEVFGLVGESGCGKSVTSMSIPALLPVPGGQVYQGDILWRGYSLLKPKDRRKALRSGRVGVIFQDPSSALNPVLTLGVQLLEVFEWLGSQDFLEGEPPKKEDKTGIKITRQQKMHKIKGMLREVGFADAERILKSYPHELSGGMLQRVMIAMALLPEPDLIIADEPTTALDVTVQAQVMEMLTKLTQKREVSVLLITHNLNLVAQYAQRLAVMYAGRIVEEGAVEQVLHFPRHPYTHGLLGALPGSKQSHEKGIRSIPGTVPHPQDFLPGCRFAPRCERATEECAKKPPFVLHGKSRETTSVYSASKQKQQEHRFACFHPLGEENPDV